MIDARQAPLRIVVGPDEADSLATEAVRIGRSRQLVAGFDVPAGEPTRVVCHGRVTDRTTAAAAILAAVWGAGLLVVLDMPEEDVAVFLADLGRIGPYQRHVAAPTAQPMALDADASTLLDRLADGATLGDVARELHLSRRTADRRLATARRALGVETTAEALVAWRRRHPPSP